MSTGALGGWTIGEKRLTFQRCQRCQHAWYFRRDFCPACGGKLPEQCFSKGVGVIAAITVIHRAPNEVFRTLAPYGVALADMDEGFRVMGHCESVATKIGDAVQLQFVERAGLLLPLFVPCG